MEVISTSGRTAQIQLIFATHANDGHGDKIRVLTRYIGNIDDGTTLRTIIAENNLQEKE